MQFGDANSLSSVGLGVMLGIRNDPRKDNSFNLGAGLVWDGSMKGLGNGFVEAEPLPTGETDVRFEERSARGVMIALSFAF